MALALVDVEATHPWENHQLQQACAKSWSKGYFAWVLKNVRPLQMPIQVIAKRKIYLVELDHP